MLQLQDGFYVPYDNYRLEKDFALAILGGTTGIVAVAQWKLPKNYITLQAFALHDSYIEEAKLSSMVIWSSFVVAISLSDSHQHEVGLLLCEATPCLTRGYHLTQNITYDKLYLNISLQILHVARIFL